MLFFYLLIIILLPIYSSHIFLSVTLCKINDIYNIIRFTFLMNWLFNVAPIFWKGALLSLIIIIIHTNDLCPFACSVCPSVPCAWAEGVYPLSAGEADVREPDDLLLRGRGADACHGCILQVGVLPPWWPGSVLSLRPLLEGHHSWGPISELCVFIYIPEF